MAEQFVVTICGGVDQIVDRLEHPDFAEEINLSHRKGGVHGSATGRAREPIAELIRIITRSEHRPMPDLGVPSLIPRDTG